MRLRSGKMTSPRPHEETSSTGDTMTPQAADTGSSMASTVSIAFVGPILPSRQPQAPTPTTMGTMGQHMPSYTTLIHRTLECRRSLWKTCITSVRLTTIHHHCHSLVIKGLDLWQPHLVGPRGSDWHLNQSQHLRQAPSSLWDNKWTKVTMKWYTC